jgi:hypothetical protein
LNISIIEARTGEVIAVIPLNLSGMNYLPTKQEYMNEAWRSAVEDDIVDVIHRDRYIFLLPEEHDGNTIDKKD